ncbi:uncharacterized protein LOC142341349 [Convolutriloba macropyga]|uniref:uncharacterized protein LOC142341349 n=1 Tax=Convolutriloba macropyga TaxID=536237 RepID=UPI003F522F23
MSLLSKSDGVYSVSSDYYSATAAASTSDKVSYQDYQSVLTGMRSNHTEDLDSDHSQEREPRPASLLSDHRWADLDNRYAYMSRMTKRASDEIESHRRSDFSRGSLPQGWSEHRDENGLPFFANNQTHNTTWEDPRTSRGLPLPPEWRLRMCSIGAYFENSRTKTTTFYDPRSGISTVTGQKEIAHLRHQKNFYWKLYEFQELFPLCSRI